MNKLIITGNGFDLAHRLPTSYSDFIKWFWNSICTNFEDTKFSNLYYFNPKYRERFSHIDTLFGHHDIINKVKNGYNFDGQIRNNINDNSILKIESDEFSKYNNIFFKFLNNSYNENVNWVDIEMCYYKLLIDSVSRTSNGIYSLKELNNQFEQVKDLFEYYLKKVVLPSIKLDESFINLKIVDIFKPIVNHDYSSKYLYKEYLKEFDQKFHSEINTINDNIKNRNILSSNESNLPTILFLDFNYTNTVDLYEDILKRRNYPYSDINIIKIHGEIDNVDNPINFGFGDEMDEQYTVLEKYNDNEYLKNIKSFHYFYNQNYRDLMNWIEVGNFQILIMGHSCGLSDRTLLNTLFEHENCASIKYFYYQSEKGDNYTDIIQNISRHFNNKKVMRNKIVNKSLTSPLPQKS